MIDSGLMVRNFTLAMMTKGSERMEAITLMLSAFNEKVSSYESVDYLNRLSNAKKTSELLIRKFSSEGDTESINFLKGLYCNIPGALPLEEQ